MVKWGCPNIYHMLGAETGEIASQEIRGATLVRVGEGVSGKGAKLLDKVLCTWS